jgi:GR25 family glycosyltransferase involved in LPS biosynthesis
VKSDDKQALIPFSLSAPIRAVPDTNITTSPDQTVFKKKACSKRPGKDRERAEDTGRLLPKPAKRCKVLDMSEPTAFMRSLEAIVINLERRPDRLQGCVERMNLNCPWLRNARFDASDGRRDAISSQEVVTSWNTASNVVYQKKRAIRKGWNDLDSYKVLDLDMSPGERGCGLSHIRAWQHCLERCGDSNQPLLVLEDDAAPTADFTPVLRRAMEVLPSNCHVLYLGYSQAADWRREISQDLVEAEYVWTTVGYLVWPEGAKYFLSHLPVDGPVDNWMAGHCAAGEINAYAVRPKIIRQADAWGVNSDVAHSDEHYWGASSDIQHSDAFYWGNPNAPTKEINMSSTIWAGLDVESSDESASEC